MPPLGDSWFIKVILVLTVVTDIRISKNIHMAHILLQVKIYSFISPHFSWLHYYDKLNDANDVRVKTKIY